VGNAARGEASPTHLQGDRVLETLNDEHQHDLRIEDIDDDDLAACCVKALKPKGGRHRLVIDLLPRKTVPEMANACVS